MGAPTSSSKRKRRVRHRVAANPRRGEGRGMPGADVEPPADQAVFDVGDGKAGAELEGVVDDWASIEEHEDVIAESIEQRRDG